MSNKFCLKNNAFANQISSLDTLRGVTKRNGLFFSEILQVKYQRGAEPLYEGSLRSLSAISTMSLKGGDK
jgi:hypothetical protein